MGTLKVQWAEANKAQLKLSKTNINFEVELFFFFGSRTLIALSGSTPNLHHLLPLLH